jgi:hypothetical protein
MRVALVNDGPVTIWIDSRRRADAPAGAAPHPEAPTETSP